MSKKYGKAFKGFSTVKIGALKMALTEKERPSSTKLSIEDLSQYITWKRGFLEIIAEILESLSEKPLKKTHITFRCNIDSRAVTKYLKILSKAGFVKEVIDNGAYFEPTKKGIKFLNEYFELVKILQK